MILVGQSGASQDLSKTIQEIFDERAHCITHVLAERVHCIYAFGEQVASREFLVSRYHSLVLQGAVI